MKEEDPTKSDLIEAGSSDSLVYNKKYYNFFENAPVALFIEDLSQIKGFIENAAKENNTDFKTYLNNNKEILKSLHRLVIINEVNATAVKLYKASCKSDLLENLSKIFTNDSEEGFAKLLSDILNGKKEASVETICKTFEGEKIYILLKFSVEKGSEDTLKSVIVSVENISKNVRFMKALAESEKRYKESQKMAKIASWFYDFNSKKIHWSNEIYDTLELNKQNTEISLEFYLSHIHNKDRKLVSNFSIENLLKNPQQKLNYRVLTNSGKLLYVTERRNAIIENGRIERIVGICQDITDRVLSENKLNATKKLLSNTLSSIQDGFVILDSESNYLFVNKVAAQLLGKKENDLIGKNIWSEFPEKEGDVFYDNYQKAFKTKKPINFENYFSPWDRWFENRIVPSSETMLLFFHEITEKKETEKKIKEAYNIINKSSSVAILCKNEWDFPVIFASENTEKLFGYTSEELLSSKIKIYELAHPDDLPNASSYFFSRLKEDKPNGYHRISFRIITKKGDIKWVEASVEIIKNSNNEITHIQGIVEDITERKKTEDLFFKSNQRLQDQFNNTPLASIIWDINDKVIEWNNSSQRIFGYTADEAKKEAKYFLVPKKLIPEIEQVNTKLLNDKGVGQTTNENITKSNETIICKWYNVVLKDVEGKIIGVASLVDDITDRIKSKKLLEKSEKKYRDIFEKSIDAVLIIKDSIFSNCNAATLKTFGYSNKEELLPIHPSQISPEFQPDGTSSFLKAEEMMKAAINQGSNRFRWYHKRKNGDIFPSEVTLTRINEHDNITTIHVVIRDITERVKKEEIEHILYNISNAALTIDNFNKFGYFIKDELSKIIDTNNFYIALYNEEKDSFYTPIMVDEKESITDFPAEKTLTGYVLKHKKSVLFTNETHKKLVESGEVGLIGVDSKIWMGIPLKTHNKAFGVIVVQSYTNIDAYNQNDVQLLEFVADQISIAILRKNIEIELKTALTKAQESDRLKSAFLANMSHEIRTPMNGIIGFSELFLNKDLSYLERKEYAKIVINSSKQLLAIVNDILDISKIEADVVQLNYEEVNINNLLSDLEAFYSPISLNKNLELICNKGLQNIDSFIEIDKTKLHQIISNLLSNAFKFTEKGSIEFGYKLVEEMLQFYVKDTGIGIDKKLHKVIFDRFVQVDEDFEKQNRGTGLGLAISKKFIELFNGTIWLDSSIKGTTVYFTIPYKKVKKQIITSVVDNLNNTTSKNKEITILVAEDEEYNLLYLNELFSKTSYKLIEATTGKQAVELALANSNIDLVLMDIKMPVMNGIDAMKKIKAERPHLPIVALSAFAMESDKEAAISNGFNSYLSKPIDKKLLFEIINECTIN